VILYEGKDSRGFYSLIGDTLNNEQIFPEILHNITVCVGTVQLELKDSYGTQTGAYVSIM